MTNKQRFITNVKITLAVRKRNRLKKMHPVSEAAITYLNSTIKELEYSLRADSHA